MPKRGLLQPSWLERVPARESAVKSRSRRPANAGPTSPPKAFTPGPIVIYIALHARCFA
jgi:hypothetical protein